MRGSLVRGSWRSLAVAALVGSLGLPGGARADQSGTGGLTGAVVDGATSKPVADVVVTATSAAQQGQQVVVTDAAGFYRIPNLAPGMYVLSLDRDQYSPFTGQDIALRADATIRVNAVLMPIGAQAQEVVIIQQAPTVDVGSSSVGSSID